MEGRGAQQATSRVDFEETIEVAREDEVLDFERPPLEPNRTCDVRRDDRLEPIAPHSGDAPEYPPRIEVQEGAELSDWNGLDWPKFAEAQSSSVPIVIEPERALKDSRGNPRRSTTTNGTGHLRSTNGNTWRTARSVSPKMVWRASMARRRTRAFEA